MFRQIWLPMLYRRAVAFTKTFFCLIYFMFLMLSFILMVSKFILLGSVLTEIKYKKNLPALSNMAKLLHIFAFSIRLLWPSWILKFSHFCQKFKLALIFTPPCKIWCDWRSTAELFRIFDFPLKCVCVI